MKDFAEALFEDIAPPPPLEETAPPPPAPEFYPGSKRKKPAKVTPPPAPSASDKPWDRHPQVLKVNGVEREFFTIGALAEAINRRPVTIRSWETKGIMPKARYRTGGKTKKRLYTREQVEGLIRLCDKHGILDFQARPDAIPGAFTDDVIALWKAEIEES